MYQSNISTEQSFCFHASHIICSVACDTLGLEGMFFFLQTVHFYSRVTVFSSIGYNMADTYRAQVLTVVFSVMRKSRHLCNRRRKHSRIETGREMKRPPKCGHISPVQAGTLTHPLISKLQCRQQALQCSMLIFS